MITPRLKILATIAHFYDAGGNGFYGSTGPNSKPRSDALRTCVAALHQTLGPNQLTLLELRKPVLAQANTAERYDIDVVICTTGAKHLIQEISLPPSHFEHRETKAEPMMLGFECHEVLRERLGQYDFYCYFEDDLVLSDPWFFVKLRWFAAHVGNDALLMPNRFELSATEPVQKLYIDGHFSTKFASAWQDIADRPAVNGRVLDTKVAFERPTNPHAGCFFLNRAQMDYWANRPYFLDRDISFIGPLESAATLGVMKTFRIYKPAPAHAGFLEILHANNRYLGNRLQTPAAKTGQAI